MEVSNYKCDFCGVIASGDDYDKPEGWYDVSMTTKDEKHFLQRRKDICPECAHKCGLPASLALLKSNG